MRWVVKPLEQRDDGALAATRFADQRHRPSGFHGEVHVVQDFLRLPRRIREMDASERYLAGDFL